MSEDGELLAGLGARAVQRVNRRGDVIEYARRALLPALEIEVVLREVSQAPLGLLEQTSLSLIEDGVDRLPSLSDLLGVPAPRLGGVLRELAQRRSISIGDSGELALSETGRLSLRRGVEIRDVSRSLLISGLDGALLPAGAYRVPRRQPAELARWSRSHHVLAPEDTIVLAALDIATVADKRSVHLPEEAEEVRSISGQPIPCFLECFLALFRTAQGERGAEISLPGAVIEGLPAARIHQHLEPFGFDHERGSSGALTDLARAFEHAGCRVQDSAIDELGNPRLVLTWLSEPALRWSCHGRSIAYSAGTGMQRALPISELLGDDDDAEQRRRFEVLGGHALTLILQSPEAHVLAERSRQLHDAVDQSRDQAGESPPANEPLDPALAAALRRVCPLAEAQALALRTRDRELSRALGVALLSPAAA